MSCGTCRHFRRAIVGRLGYCALHRSEGALTGDELRACWQSTDTPPEPYQGLLRDIEAPAKALAVTEAKPTDTRQSPRSAQAIPRGLIAAPTILPADPDRLERR
jgi:hypothetical protein